jgi:hypothetical protein
MTETSYIAYKKDNIYIVLRKETDLNTMESIYVKEEKEFNEIRELLGQYSNLSFLPCSPQDLL